MNKGLKIVGLAVAGVVALTACDPGASGGSTVYYKNGPAGQVVDRDIEDGHYELETKNSKGKKHEFNVTSSVYNDCHNLSFYPSCVRHKDSKQNVTPGWKKKQEKKAAQERKNKKSYKDGTAGLRKGTGRR